MFDLNKSKTSNYYVLLKEIKKVLDLIINIFLFYASLSIFYVNMSISINKTVINQKIYKHC